MMVYTTGHGVNGFTLAPSLGEYFLSHPDIQMPKQSKYYSINDSFHDELSPNMVNFIKKCRADKMSARYIGSLVGDFHRNMLKGGVYMYPATSKNPNGKLRLMYECSALAFLAEQAGGVATDGEKRIMEVEPKSVHQRVPFFVGSKDIMKDFKL